MTMALHKHNSTAIVQPIFQYRAHPNNSEMILLTKQCLFLLFLLVFHVAHVSAFSSTRIQGFRHAPSKVYCRKMISSGFSFEDGEQILVSVQKPLGILLEQDTDGPIMVTEIDPAGSAGRAGVRIGDVLLAVQNASVEQADLDSVLDFIQRGPRVINLRLLRAPE